MTVKRNITVLVPDELVYVLEPDCEYEFVLSREKGRIVARPAMETVPECHNYVSKERQYAEPVKECKGCRFYDLESDTCTYGM